MYLPECREFQHSGGCTSVQMQEQLKPSMGILDIIFIQKSREEVGRVIGLNWLQVASSAEVINGHILEGPNPLELLT